MHPLSLLPLTLSLSTFAFAASIPRPERSYISAKRWEANNTFDYIIVGGGTAGHRLSETKDVKVVVIEAGVDYTESPYAPIVDIPGLAVQGAGANVNDPANSLGVDWGFVTAPQKGAANRSVHYERGKMLGGSSGRNFMIYQRGSSSAYDHWVKLGNPGWSFKDLLPYFQKSVNYLAPNNALRQLKKPTPIDHALASPSCVSKPINNRRQLPVTVPTKSPTLVIPTTTAHASPPAQTFGSGPVSVSYPPFASPFGPFMIGALKEALDIKEITSFNDGSIDGAQFCTTTIEQSHGVLQRSTSRSSYLLRADKAGRMSSHSTQGRLVVVTGALVKRILFKPGTTTAIGVTFAAVDDTVWDFGSRHLPTQEEIPLYANREVILSAGVFQSPQLLMVSGIGPRKELEIHGIKVLVDLPGVGQGMQDHVFFGPTYPVSVQTFSALSDNRTFQEQQLVNFTVNRSGPFTNTAADVIAFEHLSSDLLQTIGATTLLESWPDSPHLEYIISPGFPGNFSVLTRNPSTPAFPVGQQYATILAALVAPQSRGTITIRSSNAADPPIIDPQWLTDPVDQAMAVAAFRRVRRAWSTSFMGQILEGEEIYPGPATATSAEILQFVKENLMTVWHAACTCTMRPRAKGGVLDSRLRVHGTKHLRVIDASSFPSLPAGHPQATVYALAEKGADLIMEDWNCSA